MSVISTVASFVNHTDSFVNITMNSTYQPCTSGTVESLEVVLPVSFFYLLVFVIAVTGNSLVVFVVVTNRDMQTVTNFFILNLAISDLFTDCTSLWLTPTYIFIRRWVWGKELCHLFPMFQGTAIFVSTLTLMAISVDRYVVILFPFRPRMSKKVCLSVIGSIWSISILLVVPYSANMHYQINQYGTDCPIGICGENWPMVTLRTLFGFVVLILQFGIPFIVIAVCYIRIWLSITGRQRDSIAMASNEDERRRRLLKMLVSMVVIFLCCWSPVNIMNIYRDLNMLVDPAYQAPTWFSKLFLVAHWVSISATCWNPILYAWMNDNFRHEFKAVLPCFAHSRLLARERELSYARTHNRSYNGPKRTANNNACSPENNCRAVPARFNSCDKINGSTPASKSNGVVNRLKSLPPEPDKGSEHEALMAETRRGSCTQLPGSVSTDIRLICDSKVTSL